MLVEIVIFNQKSKKMQKSKKFEEKFSKKTVFFNFAPKTLVDCFIPSFFSKNPVFSLKNQTLVKIYNNPVVAILNIAVHSYSTKQENNFDLSNTFSICVWPLVS